MLSSTDPASAGTPTPLDELLRMTRRIYEHLGLDKEDAVVVTRARVDPQTLPIPAGAEQIFFDHLMTAGLINGQTVKPLERLGVRTLADLLRLVQSHAHGDHRLYIDGIGKVGMQRLAEVLAAKGYHDWAALRLWEAR